MDDELNSWRMHYKMGCTLREIAKKYEVSISRVRNRLIKDARMKMRRPGQRKGCSNPSGKDHPNYKHGLVGGGYKGRWSKDNRPILKHREVAESVLGGTLTKKEVVHHVDNNRTNNDPKNLWVFPNQSAHWRYHKNGVVHPETIKLGDSL